MKKSPKNTNNNRALAIVRVSTAEQALEERYSIPHQRNHISQECESRELELVHFFEFIQSGAKVMSNASKEREQVMNFIKDFSINIVIVHELDRLARSMLDTLLFVDELDKLGVVFISIHDGFDTSTPQGKLQMHILAAFAEYFRKQLASKVIGGMLERAKLGKHMGRRPLGYKIGPNGYEIFDEEARTVRLIFSMYLEQNLGLRAIADSLNGMGLRSQRGNSWSHVSVREILENEVYTGTFTWSAMRIEDNHQPIIERNTWERVQARRRRKKGLGGRAQKSMFLLSGLLKCGSCSGTTMVGRTARKGNHSYRYYTCNNYASRGTKACAGGYHRADILEKLILEDIQEIASLGTALPNQKEIPSNKYLLKEELAIKQKEIKRLKLMLVRAAEAYERGDYDLDLFSKRKAAIIEQRKAAEKEIATLKSQIDGQLTPEEVAARMTKHQKHAAALLRESSPIKVKAHLQTLIDHIEVRAKEDIIIFYRS